MKKYNQFYTHLQSHSRGEITIEELQNEANKLFLPGKSCGLRRPIHAAAVLPKSGLGNQNASPVYDHRGILNLQETVLPSRFWRELRVAAWVIRFVQNHCSFF
jgi:hypothetical protein